MKSKFKILFIVLCILSAVGFCDEQNQENLDKGLKIFKKDKPQKIKVKPQKPKKEYKIDKKTLEEYSIPTDTYKNVGELEDKKIKLSGSVSRSFALNLADCIELALINNPKIKAAYEKSEVAKYQKWETLAGYTPYLDWTSSMNRQKPDLSMLRNANLNISPFNKYTLGQIGIRQLVWDFGYTQNQYTINKIEFEKSKTEIDNTVNQVICELKDAYYNLIFAFRGFHFAIIFFCGGFCRLQPQF